MPDFNRLTDSDVAALSEEISRLASASGSMEEAAGKMVRRLRASLTDADGGPACASVRFYKTHSYGELDAELQQGWQAYLVRRVPRP